MKILGPGHVYELDTTGAAHTQTLRFVEGPADNRIGDGVTSEEVIMVMIDRVTFLDSQSPSDFNKQAIAGLNQALSALEARTADRTARGVEGKSEV